MFNNFFNNNRAVHISEYGPEPYVANIDAATTQNQNFRTAYWTGNHLQVTLMSIKDEIGLEMHDHLDQFLKIEDGFGRVMMGKNKNNLNYQTDVGKGYAIFVPAGTWHNLINLGNRPIKLYSVYAPPQHPAGTIHKTREDAEAAEKEHL